MASRSPSLKVIRPTRPRAAGGAGACDAQTTTQRIVDAVSAAIVERRLMPGTKLAEQRIADIFKVSRTVVRQALNQLSRDRLIVLEPGRGAFVRQPSEEEARQVFEARALVEAGLVRALCGRITEVQLARLRAHLAEEAAAIARSDVPGRTRLLADFHVLLAEALGNAVLAEVMGDLLSRSSLVSLMMQSSHSAEESHAEHLAIVEALGRRDSRAAAKLMATHLGSVERNLRQHPRIANLEQALQPAAEGKSRRA